MSTDKGEIIGSLAGGMLAGWLIADFIRGTMNILTPFVVFVLVAVLVVTTISSLHIRNTRRR